MQPRSLFVGTPPAGESEVALAPSDNAVVLYVLITNKSGSPQPASLIYRSGDGDSYLLNNRNVPANDVYTLRCFLPMEGGESLRFVNPAGTPLDVFVGGLEHTLA